MLEPTTIPPVAQFKTHIHRTFLLTRHKLLAHVYKKSRTVTIQAKPGNEPSLPCLPPPSLLYCTPQVQPNPAIQRLFSPFAKPTNFRPAPSAVITASGRLNLITWRVQHEDLCVYTKNKKGPHWPATAKPTPPLNSRESRNLTYPPLCSLSLPWSLLSRRLCTLAACLLLGLLLSNTLIHSSWVYYLSKTGNYPSDNVGTYLGGSAWASL